MSFSGRGHSRSARRFVQGTSWRDDRALDEILSRRLSYLRRHAAEFHGLEVRRDGYVATQALLSVKDGGSETYTERDIVRVVRNNTKACLISSLGCEHGENHGVGDGTRGL